MFAQVNRVQLNAGALDQAIQIFRESVVPAASKQPGFIRAYLLVDREAETATVVSLWDTRDDVEALAESGFYQEQLGKVASLLAAPPVREVLEVVVEA